MSSENSMTEVFHYTDVDGRDLIDNWLTNLRDRRAVARTAARIEHLELGLLGDCRSVKGGVMELRINYGPWVPCLFCHDPEARHFAAGRWYQGDATV